MPQTKLSIFTSQACSFPACMLDQLLKLETAESSWMCILHLSVGFASGIAVIFFFTFYFKIIPNLEKSCKTALRISICLLNFNIFSYLLYHSFFSLFLSPHIYAYIHSYNFFCSESMFLSPYFSVIF